MAGDLVLINGVSGFVGFRVLRCALEHGYQVRAAVRTAEKADRIKSNPVIQALDKGSQLSFVIVPDIASPGANDEAVKGVKYVIHIASPLYTTVPQGGDFEEYLIQPAIRGTIGIFESAQNAGTVKRIVVTSSVITLAPPQILSQAFDEVFNAENRQPDLPGPYPDVRVAYFASKIAAFNRAEEWIAAEKPAFDVIHVHPSFVFGRDDRLTDTASFQNGTNAMPLNCALGNVDGKMQSLPNVMNHVDDAARVHVLSLDPKIKGNQSFLVTWSDYEWEDTIRIVEKHFPEAVSSGILPNTGAFGTLHTHVDSKKTEETFGFEHSSYESAVVSVVGQYLELLSKEQASK